MPRIPQTMPGAWSTSKPASPMALAENRRAAPQEAALFASALHESARLAAEGPSLRWGDGIRWRVDRSKTADGAPNLPATTVIPAKAGISRLHSAHLATHAVTKPPAARSDAPPSCSSMAASPTTISSPTRLPSPRPRGKDASSIAAATLDRYLQSIGQKRIYGTRFGRKGNAPITQEPHDRALIPGSLRTALCVPVQAGRITAFLQCDGTTGSHRVRLPDALCHRRPISEPRAPRMAHECELSEL